MINYPYYIKDNFRIPHELEDLIRETVNKGFRYLKFPSGLEQRYQDDTFSHHHQRYIKLGIWAIVLYNLFIFTDWMMLKDIYTLAWMIRLGVCTPFMLLVVFLTRWLTIKYWIDFMISVLVLLVACTIIFFLTLSNHPNVSHYHTGLILVVTFSNIIVRLPFWYALTVSSLVFIVYLLAMPFISLMPVEVMINSSVVLLIAIVITLIGNYWLEKDLRRDYLLTMLQLIDNNRLENTNLQLEQLSLLDPLTGLANRRHFDYSLDREIRTAMRENQYLSLIMLDIDNFKLFNDNYGHPTGDKCLQQIAHALRENVNRPHDLCARYGGEEFVILLPGTKQEKAIQFAETIRAYIENQQMLHGYSDISNYVTVSLGVSGGRIESYQDRLYLLEYADQAMYQAKLLGRNRVCSI